MIYNLHVVGYGGVSTYMYISMKREKKIMLC